MGYTYGVYKFQVRNAFLAITNKVVRKMKRMVLLGVIVVMIAGSVTATPIDLQIGCRPQGMGVL